MTDSTLLQTLLLIFHVWFSQILRGNCRVQHHISCVRRDVMMCSRLDLTSFISPQCSVLPQPKRQAHWWLVWLLHPLRGCVPLFSAVLPCCVVSGWWSSRGGGRLSEILWRCWDPSLPCTLPRGYLDVTMYQTPATSFYGLNLMEAFAVPSLKSLSQTLHFGFCSMHYDLQGLVSL